MKRILASIAALVAVFLCSPSYAAVETADLVCETTATTGTGTVSLAGSATGYLGFVAGGISSGATVPYTIQDGTSFEAGWGTFTDSSPDTLTRTATNSSDGVGSELSLSGSATVCVGPISSYFRRAYRVAEFFWWTASSTCPAGSLLANGASVSRTTYADLWSEVSGSAVATGSKDDSDYSTGNLSTTFELPDLLTEDMHIRGGTFGTVTASGAPDIDGTFRVSRTFPSETVSGAFSIANSGANVGTASDGGNSAEFTFAASANESTYSDSVSEIQVDAVNWTPCIAY